MKARLALCALTLAMPGALHAATCSVSASSVAFGTYSPFSLLPLDTAGNVQVSCSDVLLAQSYTVRLAPGGGGYAARRMSGGAYALDYNLYADAAHTLVWGDGSAGTVTVTGAFAVSGTANHPVYGRVLPRQNVAPGGYADAITVTVEY